MESDRGGWLRDSSPFILFLKLGRVFTLGEFRIYGKEKRERDIYIYIFIEFRYVGVNYVNRNRERFSLGEKNVKINEKHRAELMDTFKNRRRATPPSLLIKPVFPSTRIWNRRPGLWTRWFV